LIERSLHDNRLELNTRRMPEGIYLSYNLAGVVAQET
jgi:hypothetical protein